jgi:hypothetical protein
MDCLSPITYYPYIYYLSLSPLRLADLFRPPGRYAFAPNLFRLASRPALNLDFLFRSPYFPNRPLRLKDSPLVFS